MNKTRSKGEIWSTENMFKPPPSSEFIDGRPKAPLLFWFFCGLDVVCDFVL